MYYNYYYELASQITPSKISDHGRKTIVLYTIAIGDNSTKTLQTSLKDHTEVFSMFFAAQGKAWWTLANICCTFSVIEKIMYSHTPSGAFRGARGL